MVEGHSVHRVATLHRNRLIGKKFKAWSPNGRFTEGANAIDGKTFSRIEAVGKNLFAFFGEGDDLVVVHVHFGMAGRWAVYLSESPPEPTKTNRLRLECPGIVADLSAMTVQHGGMDLYEEKRAKLGEDPLRDDADPETLWKRVQKSKKSIGALIMDQSYFTGPGNIYRAEILFKAGVHPDKLGNEVEKNEFDSIWHHTVDLLKRGYETGSILTVDAEEARALGKPKMRRYIYNTSKCPRCGTPIKTWQIANRTCYACNRCQPLKSVPAVVTPQNDCVPFNSHCARESTKERLLAGGPSRLTMKELKAELSKLGIDVPPSSKKAKLAELLDEARGKKLPVFISSEDAAAEKAAAGENLAVEHIAELAPSQARVARARADKAGEKSFSKHTVAQLQKKLRDLGVELPSKPTKATLVDLLKTALKKQLPDITESRKVLSMDKTVNHDEKSKKGAKATARRKVFISSEDAAAEKAAAGESLAVEHIAELAPSQARLARARADKAGENIFSKHTVAQLKKKLHDLDVELPSKPTKVILADLLKAALEKQPPDVTESRNVMPSQTIPKKGAKARAKRKAAPVTPQKRSKTARSQI